LFAGLHARFNSVTRFIGRQMDGWSHQFIEDLVMTAYGSDRSGVNMEARSCEKCLPRANPMEVGKLGKARKLRCRLPDHQGPRSRASALLHSLIRE
jgi:hypothetical protein